MLFVVRFLQLKLQFSDVLIELVLLLQIMQLLLPQLFEVGSNASRLLEDCQQLKVVVDVDVQDLAQLRNLVGGLFQLLA